MFEFNEPRFKQAMFKNKKLEHRTGNSIKLFPFPANATTIKESDEDLKDFMGIAGACFRECLSYSHNHSFNKEKFIFDICETAGAAGNQDFADIIERVAFNEKGQLVLFDMLIYPHIRNGSSKENKPLNDIARFIVNLFFDEEDKTKLRNLIKKEPENLFYKLILTCLPEPQPAAYSSDRYYLGSPEIRAKFKMDLDTLINDSALFLSGFHHLIKFYFFRYVSDLAIRLNQFFADKNDQLFFSMKWEKLQDFREPMTHGWELLMHHINPMFSHAVTLELLNFIDGFGEEPVTYQEIKVISDSLGENERAELIAAINHASEAYRAGVKDVSWERFQEQTTGRNPVESAIKKLFYMIEFQFNETSRERARTAYQEWMKETTKFTFGRRRGQLGYSLAIDKDFLLLMTRLCVGQEEKIRLKDLKEGLAARGILLDDQSNEQVNAHLEKVNLLEKKSDSGDAQYIRKFSHTQA